MNLKYGLKIWSTNKEYFTEISRLYEQKKFSYLELFSVPDSYDEMGPKWKTLICEQSIPTIIHAAHHTQGMNLAKKENALSNEKLATEAFRFADDSLATGVIFHPGCDGNEYETAYQISRFNDSRIIIENKPRMGIDGITRCCGWKPEQISFILEKTDCRFCLDVSHAICAANSEKLDPYQLLGEFNQLRPTLYHLCDNEMDTWKDLHKHIGEGEYNYHKIAETLQWDKQDAVNITLEVPKKYKDCLVDFLEDIEKLEETLKSDSVKK